MHTAPNTQRSARGHRGVSSVLAMMFLVIFGSLAAAMTVVAHGNMRTASSGLQVSRSMSAAETGLVFASIRLQREASKFIIDRGNVDAAFCERLWMGTYTGADGTVEVPPGVGPGIVHAVRSAHVADAHAFDVEPGDSALPQIDGFGKLSTKPIALTAVGGGAPNPNGPYFRLTYELVADYPYVRVTSRGTAPGPSGNAVTRTLQMDFQITKKIEFAMLSTNRVMIGKNVRVEGPVGSRWGVEPLELDCDHCHPLVVRSDFYHLDPTLDSKLDLFFARVAQYDVAGDGRLRPNHPVESQGLAGTPFIDYTGNGFVDDYDIFLQHYDANNDGMVVYDAALAADAGLGSLAVEFSADKQLARLIDRAVPDRNGDGRISIADTLLGYNDGVLDGRDPYAKVRGRHAFAIARSEWEDAQGGASYQEFVRGPVRPGIDRPAVLFEVNEEDMLELTTSMFDDSNAWFDSKGSGSFGSQASGQGGMWPVPAPTPECDGPGWSGWEPVPYGSPTPYEHYCRPVYQDMTFTNVRIPKGLNALFINCTFIGVTFIETEPENTHPNWNFAGSVKEDPMSPGTFIEKLIMEDGSIPAAELPDGTMVTDTRPHSNSIRFHDCTFLGSISGIRPKSFTHWRNKVQMTGETRFYLDPDDPDLNDQPDAASIKATLNGLSATDVKEMAKSSILMPGWSMDLGAFTSDPFADPADAARVKLRGLIVAGVLDIRGSADVHGTLLMTHRPELGEGALAYMVPPFAPPDCSTCLAGFTSVFGFFGPGDGDFEGIGPGQQGFDGFGEITLRYDPNALLPDGIPWRLKAEPVQITYTEGGL